MVQSHSDRDDREDLARLVEICGRSDSMALLMWRLLGRFARLQLQVEALRREVERLKEQ